jgi:hypothetical protein
MLCVQVVPATLPSAHDQVPVDAAALNVELAGTVSVTTTPVTETPVTS